MLPKELPFSLPTESTLPKEPPLSLPKKSKPTPRKEPPMLFSALGDSFYASAEFAAAEFLASGNMPGELGTRVNQDLNMIAGR